MGLSAQDNLKDANMNFKNENYQLALSQYLKIYKTDTNNFSVISRIAQCYVNTNSNPEEALPFFEKALIQKPNDKNLILGYGRILHHLHRFDEAMEQFTKLKDTYRMKEADYFIQITENARSFVENAADITFINLGPAVNSAVDDYNPFINETEDMLIFNSNRKYDREFNVYVSDVYFSVKGKKGWQKAKGMQGLSTSEDEFAVGLHENWLITQLKHYDAYDDIYFVPRKKQSFGAPVAPIGLINTTDIENGACLSINEDTLFFASNRPGGMGGFDLYFSIRLPDGTWGPAINMGPQVNTMFHEDYPNISADDSKLYFASNRADGMGGFDIYMINRMADGQWSMPHNLGYPVNSTYDNFIISFSADQRYAYVADVRNEGSGGLDIYKIIFNTSEPPTYICRYNLMSGNSENPEPFQDSNRVFKINLYSTKNELVGQFIPDKKLGFIVAIKPGNFRLTIETDGFEPYSENLSIPDELVVPEKKTIYLVKKP